MDEKIKPKKINRSDATKSCVRCVYSDVCICWVRGCVVGVLRLADGRIVVQGNQDRGSIDNQWSQPI